MPVGASPRPSSFNAAAACDFCCSANSFAPGVCISPDTPAVIPIAAAALGVTACITSCASLIFRKPPDMPDKVLDTAAYWSSIAAMLSRVVDVTCF